MNDVLAAIESWRERGEQVAIATVIKALGSSPRQVGAKMAVSTGGSIAGSVSGGCIEGAVFEISQEAITSGEAQALHFGVADETAWEVGLACGGTIDVFVEPLPALFDTMRDAIENQRPLASVVVLRGALRPGARLLVAPDGATQGSSGDAELDATLAADAQALLAKGENAVRSYQSTKGEVDVFIESLVPPPVLYIVGAVHIASALVKLAKVLDFRTVVVDAREAFATSERFPDVDELVTSWPDEALEGRLGPSSYVAMLTHDPKLDDPALRVALNSQARYIGALGSKRTHAARLERLKAEGFSDEQLARIRGPIGLSIGARTPQEIALSILAEIVQTMRSNA